MNVLPFDQQVQMIAALVDGCSIRATERMIGVHRDTIMRLAVRVGEGCARIHDEMMRGLQVNLVEMDEAWAYIGKKQKRLTPDDSAEKGDCYTFIAMDATRKAILSDRVGKRDGENTVAFCQDLRDRIVGRPQIFWMRGVPTPTRSSAPSALRLITLRSSRRTTVSRL